MSPFWQNTVHTIVQHVIIEVPYWLLNDGCTLLLIDIDEPEGGLLCQAMIMCTNLDVASSKPSEIGSQSFLALEKDTNEQHTDFFFKLGRSTPSPEHWHVSWRGWRWHLDLPLEG